MGSIGVGLISGSSVSIPIDTEPCLPGRSSVEVAPRTAVPLIVDLDGTLIRTDLLLETWLDTLASGPAHHAAMAAAACRSPAALKAMLAERASIDATLLPYDRSVLDLVRAARDAGRPVYLATASDRRPAEAVAAHLQLFDGVFASDGRTNLKSAAKARLLVGRFGSRGFDYVGNSADDLAVWAAAREAYAVRVPGGVRRGLASREPAAIHLGPVPRPLGTWLRALRVHQWAKNLLVFVPLLTSHLWTGQAVVASLLAFVCFCACASGGYVINDLIDLGPDRRHPTKRQRPFASGALGPADGLLAIPLLLGFALLCSVTVSFVLTAVLAGYLALTVGYSISLKRKMIVDVVVLALLYTTRIFGGAAAIDVDVSQWLLGFSMFLFVGLALVKRYVELASILDQGLPDPTNRNYRATDLPVIAAVAAGCGFNASRSSRSTSHRPRSSNSTGGRNCSG